MVRGFEPGGARQGGTGHRRKGQSNLAKPLAKAFSNIGLILGRGAGLQDLFRARKSASSTTSLQRKHIGATTSKAARVALRDKRVKDKKLSSIWSSGTSGTIKFAEALLREGIDALLCGDLETGKTILRDYIKATIGFERLGAATGAPPKSLIRMFGPRGNPQAKNLFDIIGYLQKQAGIELRVALRP